MAKPSEVTDPFLHATLTEAEKAVDDGDWNEAVHKAVEAYKALADKRPDVIMRAGPAMGALPLEGRVPQRGAMRPWPSLLGVTLTFDANDKPKLEFTKDRFTMSDAVTYFEYALDCAVLAQRTPAPA